MKRFQLWTMMDYDGLSWTIMGGSHHRLSLTVKDPKLSYKAIYILLSTIGSISTFSVAEATLHSQMSIRLSVSLSVRKQNPSTA